MSYRTSLGALGLLALGSLGCAKPVATPTPDPEPPAPRPSIASLVEQLHSDDPEQHERAAEQLRVRGREAAPALIDGFKDKEFAFRVRASEIVASMGPPVLPLLVDEIDDGYPGPERLSRLTMSVETIRRMGSAAAPVSADLLALVRSTTAYRVPDLVADAWIAMGPVALPQMEAALRDDDSSVVTAGYHAMWRTGEPAVEPLLRVVEDGKTETLRQTAANALSAMFGMSWRSVGGQVLHDPSSRRRVHYSIDGEAVGEQVISVLCGRQRADGTFPAEARSVLRNLGTPEVLCASPEGRAAVAGFVRKVEGSEQVPQFIERLEGDRDPEIRARAARALGIWLRDPTHESASIIDALIGATTGADTVARSAADSLWQLQERQTDRTIDAIVGCSCRACVHYLSRKLAQLGERPMSIFLRVSRDESETLVSRIRALDLLSDFDLHDHPGTKEQLRDKDEAVRAAAQARIDRLEVDARTTLERLVDHEEPKIRAAATTALVDRFVRTAELPSLMPLLLRQSKHRDPEVRLAAIYGLRRLLPPRGSTMRWVASAPEATHSVPDPARTFSTKICVRVRSKPPAGADEPQRKAWAARRSTCRLAKLRKDSEPEIQQKVAEALRYAGIELRP